MCRYRLSAFGEFYKIHQEVLETEGTMALTVVVKETPLRDFTTKLIRCSKNELKHNNAHQSVVAIIEDPIKKVVLVDK